MNKKTSEFLSLLTNDKALELANYILDIIGNSGEEPNPIKSLEYDFKVKKGGLMEVTDYNPNTSFSFDFPVGHFGKRLVELMADEEVETDNAVVLALEDFRKAIASHLNTFKDKLNIKLSKAVFGSETNLPLKDLRVMGIYLIPLPEADWVLTVQRNAPKDYISEPVASEVMKEHIESGKDLAVILKEKHEAGIEKYKYVTELSKNKSFYECDLLIWVDYSVI